jgi:hypothetical protein
MDFAMMAMRNTPQDGPPELKAACHDLFARALFQAGDAHGAFFQQGIAVQLVPGDAAMRERLRRYEDAAQ